MVQKKGHCHFGDQCYRAHGQEELRGMHEPLEDFLVGQRMRNPHVLDYQVVDQKVA